MALPFTDEMTDTNGTAIESHNAGWDNYLGNTDIQTNAAQGNGSGFNINGWTGDTVDPDHKITGTQDGGGGGGVHNALVARGSNGGSGLTGYALLSNLGADERLVRYDDGSPTNLDTTGASWSDGSIIILQIVGDVIDGTVDGTQDYDATDATHSTGAASFGGRADNAAIRWTSITIEDVNPAAGATPHGVFGIALHGPFGGPI